MKSKTANAPFRAEDLIGKTWMYRGKAIKVLRIEEDGLDIVADKKTYRFSLPSEVADFVKECLPMDDEQPGENLPATNGQSGVVMFNANKASNDLFEQLLFELKDDFDKLKTDKEYVPQAKQRGNHIREMVGLAKLKMQFDKQQNKRV